MSRDLTIRLLGRPNVTTDKVTGLKKLVRKYVVEGPRASKAGIDDPDFPLFLPGGSTDEEFTDYFLTNQVLSPAEGTLDKAYLQREFLQLKTAPISESRLESVDLIRLTKRYAVIRGNHPDVGYGDAWSRHPSNGVGSTNPWYYAPANAKVSPENVQYNYDTLTSSSGFTDTPVVSYLGADGYSENDVPVGQFLSSNFVGSGVWLQGRASFIRAGSELDIWSLEWITHNDPYWTIGTTSKSFTNTNARRKVDFDHLGIEIRDEGGTASGTTNVKAKTLVSFEVASDAPEELTKIAGGSYTTSSNASVNVDLFFEDAEGKSWALKQNFKNAVWTSSTRATIEFPNAAGDNVEVGRHNGGWAFEFDYNAMDADDLKLTKDVKSLPMFQMKPIRKMGGRISWTLTSRSGIAQTGNLSNTTTTIKPIFSGQGRKIWKVEITYVGS
jgi:hypothetical protein